MSKRCEIMRKLHDNGMTYEQIGEQFGVSKQAVHQLLNRAPGDYFQEGAIKRVKYVGLRQWMLENRVSITKLESLCGISRKHRVLIGQAQPSKTTIDKILAVTGLTYEECFKEDPQNP